MIMYMDGFRFSLKGGQPCLNLFFPEWTLDSKGKFVAAMVGVLLLAVAVEGVSKLRYCIIRAAKASYRSPDQNQWNLTLLRFGISSMHGKFSIIKQRKWRVRQHIESKIRNILCW
jgi:hypothetical protein